jgi:hypothetical protein
MRVREPIVILSAVACLSACSSGGGTGNEKTTGSSADSSTTEADSSSNSDATSGTDGSRSTAESGNDASSSTPESGSGASSDSSTAVGSDASAPCEGGALFKPTEVTRVAGWLSDTSSGLPNYAYTNIDTYFPVGDAGADPSTGHYPRTLLVDSIVGACSAFAPRLPNWQEYCEAILTSEIVSESSYEPGTPTPGPPSTTSVNYDAYGTMNGDNDPTVGLLQVRFSSTVQSYNSSGSIPTIEAIGCSWPAAFATASSGFWTSEGGTVTYLTFMENPACNIPLAAWYIFQNATGNGGATAVYTAQYCAGQGVAGNVVDGLLSYLEGPGFPRGTPDAEASNSYPAGIKTRFIQLVGGSLPSPDPFEVSLSPETCVYCN